jgi:NAD(P)-dependent dehydrogenase (short-subunit alcohol dehydrogenase family)
MSQPQEIQRLMDETVSAMGRLDVVISNQGWTRMRNFDDLDDNVDETDWDGCFNMNVKSHLWLFHAAKPHLNKTEGSFVSVASLAGVIPSGSSIVCGSKTGLFAEHQLTEVLTGLLGDQSGPAAPC